MSRKFGSGSDCDEDSGCAVLPPHQRSRHAGDVAEEGIQTWYVAREDEN